MAKYIYKCYTLFMMAKTFFSVFTLCCFIITSVFGTCPVYAQEFHLPAPGVMVHLSPEYTPAYLKGIVIHPENALKFDFIIYKGDKPLSNSEKKEEYTKLAKYFMASLAIPDDDQWVNLSPYEKDRIIQDDFGKTEMGWDLLAEDYMLKQITASLIYPEDNLGKKFWDKVYAEAQRKYGTTNVLVNTFNKVWILPDDALIYEKGNAAYVLKNHLKVMLEEDYLALQKHNGITTQRQPGDMFPAQRGTCPQAGCQASKPLNVKALQGNDSPTSEGTNALGSEIVRAIVLPELEREVNEGKNFAALRQIYSGMLLATWYKRALKESLLSRIYANKAKIKGIDQDPKNNEAIYKQYLRAYKKGVFNFIKDDVDKYTNETIPRKYFSGGITGSYAQAAEQLKRKVFFVEKAISLQDDDALINDLSSNYDYAQITTEGARTFQKAATDPAMNSQIILLKPFVNIDDTYNKLPMYIRDEIRHISEKGNWGITEYELEAIYGLIIKIGNIYRFKMHLTTQNYHNHLHQMLVIYASLVLADSDNIIKSKRDLIDLILAALFHDFHIRDIRDKFNLNGDAFVPETLGRIDNEGNIESGGQLLDLFGIRVVGQTSGTGFSRVLYRFGIGKEGQSFQYKYPTRADSRYTDWITPQDKKEIRRYIRRIIGEEDLQEYFKEWSAIIRLTDYKASPIGNTYDTESELNDFTQRMEGVLRSDNIEGGDLDGLISEANSVYNEIDDKILKYSRRENIVQLKEWSDRQREITVSFLRDLKRVNPGRRSQVVAIANNVELADRSGSTWLVHWSLFLVSIILGLQRELPFVSIESTYADFLVPQFLSKPKILERLANLPLEYKLNFVRNVEQFAQQASNSKEVWARFGRDNPIARSFNDWQERKTDVYDLLKISNGDFAMAAQDSSNKIMISRVSKTNHSPFSDPGGIDLNSANLNLQIKRDGNGVPLPVSQQDLENIHIDGLVPVIIDIKPVSSTPLLSQLQSSH